MTPAMTTALLAAGLPVALYGSPLIAKVWSRSSLRRRCSRTGTLVLTYDDGPGPEATPRVLEILRRFSATASFFPTGQRARAHTDLLDLVAGEGHEIGCHSESHLHAWKVGPRRAVRDAVAGLDTLAPWSRRPGLFRPPYGKLDLVTWLAVRRRETRLAWWTIDSGDTRALLPDPHSIAERLIASRGGVVLMHDLHSVSDRIAYVCDLTQALLKSAERERLRVVPLGSLLKGRLEQAR